MHRYIWVTKEHTMPGNAGCPSISVFFFSLIDKMHDFQLCAWPSRTKYFLSHHLLKLTVAMHLRPKCKPIVCNSRSYTPSGIAQLLKQRLVYMCFSQKVFHKMSLLHSDRSKKPNTMNSLKIAYHSDSLKIEIFFNRQRLFSLTTEGHHCNS